MGRSPPATRRCGRSWPSTPMRTSWTSPSTSREPAYSPTFGESYFSELGANGVLRSSPRNVLLRLAPGAGGGPSPLGSESWGSLLAKTAPGFLLVILLPLLTPPLAIAVGGGAHRLLVLQAGAYGPGHRGKRGGKPRQTQVLPQA